LAQLHDPSKWAFGHYLQNPEFHLHEYLLSMHPALYWLMRAGTSILEVGAGTGRGCILAKRLCPHKRVVASDISTHSCEVMREYIRLTGVEVDVVECDARDLPFEDDEFDIVFSSGLLEHYDDDWIVDSLREQRRVAAMAVVASVPTDMYYILFKTWHGDERSLSKADWLNLFQKAGPLANLVQQGAYNEEHSLLVAIDARAQQGDSPG
jgi:SAM-dependent methyltransferase